jgi:geranylgeranyl reductase family protein
MIRCDALIVGGGPAGSTCARLLRLAGWDVLLLDRAAFPRDKVCAGWITTEVFGLLHLDPSEYRDAGFTLQEISGFRTGVLHDRQVETRYPGIVSYSVRRCEFDTFLLRRAQVRVLEQTPLTRLRRAGDGWIANEDIRTPLVIGAGGHFCPVARHLQGDAGTTPPVVAKEAEYRLEGRPTSVAPEVPELFFCRDLEGYGWCVRKGDYVNVGIGRRDSYDFGRQVSAFAAYLEQSDRAPGASRAKWRGHAYLASGTGSRPLADAGVLLIGDAAGLAYPESGEGIKPAIESACLAARTVIAARGRHGVDDLQPYATTMRRMHPPAWHPPPALEGVTTAIGRAMLRSALLTRHLVLDRWFLRRKGTRDLGN